MAFTEFFVQTTGSNLNAGSSNADAAAFTYTSSLVGGWNSGTGVFEVASGNPSGDGVAVGDFASVYVTAGATVTNFVARVTARTTTTITVSTTVKSGTAPATDSLGGTTIKIGGAWAGPNAAVGFPFNFVAGAMMDASSNRPRVNFKNGTTYNVTAAITHTVGGPSKFQGYTTTPGDGGKAIIDGGTSGASYVLFAMSGSVQSLVEDIIFDHNGSTGSSDGVQIGSTAGGGIGNSARRIVVRNMVGNGLVAQTASVSNLDHWLLECEAHGNNTSNTVGKAGIVVSSGCSALRCISHDNTGSNANGIIVVGGRLINSISESNGADGISAIAGNSQGPMILGCDLYNNGGDGIGIEASASQVAYIENCNLVKNGGYGINTVGAGTLQLLIVNCGFGAGTQANTSGQTNLTSGTDAVEVIGSVTYANDVTPWVDPANGDFRINLSTAKGAGRGTFTQTASSYTGSIGYPDIGSNQHLESSSGGSPSIGLGSPVIRAL